MVILLILTASSGSNKMTTNGLQQNLRELRRARDKAARYNSHVNFLTTCLQQKLIPKGMRAKFGHDALPKNDFLQKHVRDSLHSASLDIVSSVKRHIQFC
ncbi:hypothetical protein ACOMHN_066539 [Nucella lapillus]